jgi:hypothetical protein
MSQELFLEILQYILRNNYFVFEDQFFLQEDNLAMGSSISSVSSSFVMEHIIDTIMIETGHHIEHLFLYVDDTFIIIDEEEAENALMLFNDFHP